MIDGRRVLAIVPARGGSKGLPGKNIRRAGGRSLLSFSVDAARHSTCVDLVIVSSDDAQIIAAAHACGATVPFVRPAALATDSAATIDVVLHAIEEMPGFDLVVLLQPTSPLRTAADIDAALALMSEHGAPACVSITLAEQSPYWMYSLSPAGRMRPLVETPAGISRRQDLPDAYVLNGAIYIADVSWLRASRSFVTPDTVPYVMPRNRSIDIDTAADFDLFMKALTDNDPS